MSKIAETFNSYRVLEIREPLSGDKFAPIVIIAEKTETKTRRRIEVYRSCRELAQSAKMLIAGDLIGVREWKMDDGKLVLKELVTYFNEEINETSEICELVQEDYGSLKDGDDVYYVDFKDNMVIEGSAFDVRRKSPDDGVRYLSIVMPNDFMGCAGELLGEKVFLSKELAENKLREGEKNV